MARIAFAQPEKWVPDTSTAVDHPKSHRHKFLQHPFVQNLLPFITSLSVHAGILIFALMVYGAVQLAHRPPDRIVYVSPTDSPMLLNSIPGGVPFVGLNHDPFTEARQNSDPTARTSGIFDKKSIPLDLGSAGKGDEASMIGVGPMDAFGGRGDLPGSGSGGGGPISRIGPPGGGAPGPQSPVFVPGPSGPNARLIVFLCDATGSMINKMATLKDELNKAVVGLRPNQSFDIFFFQGEQMERFSPVLVAAVPENKRKAGNYLDGITATSTTNPIPSLEAALKLKPHLLYFLTDAADFPDNDALLASIKKNNLGNRTKINTILFVENKAERDKNAESEVLMRKIANDSGGTFRWVEMDDLK